MPPKQKPKRKSSSSNSQSSASSASPNPFNSSKSQQKSTNISSFYNQTKLDGFFQSPPNSKKAKLHHDSGSLDSDEAKDNVLEMNSELDIEQNELQAPCTPAAKRIVEVESPETMRISKTILLDFKDDAEDMEETEMETEFVIGVRNELGHRVDDISEESVPNKMDLEIEEQAIALLSPDKLQGTLETLRQFDLDMKFGPTIGLTRLDRYKRAISMGLDPPTDVGIVVSSKLGSEIDEVRECVFWGYKDLI
ncbi:hypothetical protein BKA69DRAFT_1042207 [Paraphysoderma sedebokerense]|nr:hypothetical protein BKA69DRAFT_1042207 [Paraphysoderma sedebokerense]